MSSSDICRPEIKKATYTKCLVLAEIKVGDRPSLESALQIILKMVKTTPSKSKIESIEGKSMTDIEGGTKTD
jgi:hypothetical protein